MRDSKKVEPSDVDGSLRTALELGIRSISLQLDLVLRSESAPSRALLALRRALDAFDLATERDDAIPACREVTDGDRRVLIQVVEHAEANPALDFVAWGFLRDKLLPARIGSSLDRNTSQRIVSDAVRDGILSTHQIANPNMPDRATSTVTLVRSHPLVLEVLASPPTSTFKPIVMPGAPLSRTVIEGRR